MSIMYLYLSVWKEFFLVIIILTKQKKKKKVLVCLEILLFDSLSVYPIFF